MADSSHVGTVLDPVTFKLLVEEGADAMFIVCHGGPGLAYVNPALVAVLGYDDAGELIGRDATETVIHPSDQAMIRRIEANARAGNAHHEPLPVRWQRKDGSAVAVVGGSSQITYGGRRATLVVARRDAALRALQLAEER
ncbi:MAG: PAS domain-containing protein, partial [Kofleriaceae bacterium]